MNTADLVFDNTGDVACLYTELVDLHTLGNFRCRRASHLEFNENTQEWEVLTPDHNTFLYSHPSRETCLAWERENLSP